MRRFTGYLMLGLLLASLLALAACSSSGPKPTPAAPPVSNPGDVLGKEWALTGSSMSAVDFSQIGITARFEEGRISGFSGVNTYNGSCVLGPDGSIKVGPLAATTMAGPQALMTAESTYLALLETASSYSVSGPQLTLLTNGAALTYTVQRPATLPGSKWQVTGYNNGKQAVVSVSASSTVTLGFNADGTVSGNGGINTFGGTYRAAEASITIGPLTSTKIAGPEDLMAQETAFLAALQKAGSWDVVNGQLELRDDAGALQVNANAE